MTKITHSKINNIWYPGSAYADAGWITYLQSKFKGNWIFSDTCVTYIENQTVGKRYYYDTLSDEIPEWLNNTNIHTLVLSWHPGLHSFAEISDSNLLSNINPKVIIFDPGSPNVGNIENHLSEIPYFENAGYSLSEIIVIPEFNHQYCKFIKIK